MDEGTKPFAKGGFFKYFVALRLCRWSLVLATIMGLICGISSGFGIPVLLKLLAGKIFGETQTVIVLLSYCLLPLGLVIVRALSGFLNTYLLSVVGQHVLVFLRMKIFRKLQRLPIAYFRNHSPGEIISKAFNDATLIQSCFMSVAHDIIQCPITLIGAFSAIIYLCLKETDVFMLLLVFGLVSLTIFPIRRLGRRIRRRNLQSQEEIARLTTRLAQNLRATEEIRAFCMEDREIEDYHRANLTYARCYLRACRSYYFINPSVEILAAVGVCFAMFYAHFLRISGETFLAIGSALYFSYDPIKSLGRMNGNIQCALASLSRIEVLLNEPESIADPDRPQWPQRVEGTVEFVGVNFAYDPDFPLLRSIDLRLEAGKRYALVGASGSGKTTIANLILRFYDVNEGAVLVSGRDVRKMAQRDLRSIISLVPQQPILLNDTIYHNILWGNPQATREDIWRAIRTAQAEEFIASMECGLETVIGENGSCLSVGQRQRLALARAFLKPSKILIMDEATSALDMNSEERINDVLRHSFDDRTILVISHRFTLLPYVDEIFVLEAGQIVQRGSHRRLLDEEGLYKRLYLLHTEGLDGSN